MKCCNTIEIYSIIALLGLCYTFVPTFMYPFDGSEYPEELTDSLPLTSNCHSYYRRAILISLPVLSPLLMDTLLDYANTTTLYNIELMRFGLLLCFCIPNITIYIIADTKPMLFITANMFQLISVFYCCIQLLIFYDGQFWNIDRITKLTILHVCTIIGVTSYFSNIRYVSFLFFFGIIEVMYFSYLYVVMVKKYWCIVFSSSDEDADSITNEDESYANGIVENKYINANASTIGDSIITTNVPNTEKAEAQINSICSTSFDIRVHFFKCSAYCKSVIIVLKATCHKLYELRNLSSDDINSCIYASCVLLLLICAIVLPVFPDTIIPTSTYFTIGSFITTIALMILTIFPGRLARWMVAKSDVSGVIASCTDVSLQ